MVMTKWLVYQMEFCINQVCVNVLALAGLSG